MKKIPFILSEGKKSNFISQLNLFFPAPIIFSQSLLEIPRTCSGGGGMVCIFIHLSSPSGGSSPGVGRLEEKWGRVINTSLVHWVCSYSSLLVFTVLLPYGRDANASFLLWHLYDLWGQEGACKAFQPCSSPTREIWCKLDFFHPTSALTTGNTTHRLLLQASPYPKIAHLDATLAK